MEAIADHSCTDRSTRPLHAAVQQQLRRNPIRARILGGVRRKIRGAVERQPRCAQRRYLRVEIVVRDKSDGQRRSAAATRRCRCDGDLARCDGGDDAQRVLDEGVAALAQRLHGVR
jgi:hypothetical protein